MQSNRVVKNVSWLIVCRIAQALLSLVISMMTARYLGPSNFGLINYAVSVVAFVSPIMKLGLDSILVQEYINDTKKDGEIAGTALGMNLISAILCILGIVTFSAIANYGEWTTILVCALHGLVLLAQATEMILFWFQSKLMSKYIAIVSLGAYICVSIYKIFLLITSKSIFWFAISNALDYLIIGVTLHFFYQRLSGSRLVFSIKRAKSMLARSKYYIISGLMVTIFSQTDRIMLKIMVDDAAVGYYSAAVTCASVSSFVFTALIDSMRPVILEAKNTDLQVYEHRIKQLYAAVIYLALAECVMVTILADYVVYYVYGPQYVQTVPVLKIIVWYSTFSFYGGAKDVWILAEGKQRYLLVLNLMGALANIFLNWLLIPWWGISGAAIASVVTQMITNVGFGFIVAPLRHNNILLLQSIHPKYLAEIVTATVKVIRK